MCEIECDCFVRVSARPRFSRLSVRLVLVLAIGSKRRRRRRRQRQRFCSRQSRGELKSRTDGRWREMLSRSIGHGDGAHIQQGVVLEGANGNVCITAERGEGGHGKGTGIRARYMWVDTSTSIGSPQSPLIACHKARPSLLCSGG